MRRYLIVACLLLASCVGAKARSEALLPALQQTWPNVRADYEVGVGDGLADGDIGEAERSVLIGLADDLGAALGKGDRLGATLVPWESQMRAWALRGAWARVDAGELGPNGVQLLLQRVDAFTEALMKWEVAR